MKKLIILVVQSVFIMLLTANPAFAQKNCDYVFNESRAAAEKFEQAKTRGGDSSLSRLYQASVAAQNRFQRCLDEGGTLTASGVNKTPGSSSNGGDTDDDGDTENQETFTAFSGDTPLVFLNSGTGVTTEDAGVDVSRTVRGGCVSR